MVGVDHGASRDLWQLLAQVTRQGLAALIAMAGILVGVRVASILLPGIRVREALAVGAGFG